LINQFLPDDMNTLTDQTLYSNDHIKHCMVQFRDEFVDFEMNKFSIV